MRNRRADMSGPYLFLIVLSGLILAAFSLFLPQVASAQPMPDWKERWEKILSAAKKEGKVVVWGPPGVYRDALSQGFKTRFPEIDFEYTGAAGRDQATKINAERDGGVFSLDVLISGTTTMLSRVKSIKALDPIKPVLMFPEVIDPKYWLENRLEFADAEQVYNVVFINQLWPILAYNLREVKPEEIDDLPKLLNPKWKDRIVINDPMLGGSGHVTFQWLWRVLGPDKAKEYYKNIRTQAGAVDRDYRRMVEWIAQGKYAVLLSPTGLEQQLLQRGLKFGLLPEFKDYGGYVSPALGSVGLVNRAPHPNAAQVFLNWLLSRDGQTSWSKSTGEPSRRTDVPIDHVAPFLVAKPGAKYWSQDYKPGYRYWISYSEVNAVRTPEEDKAVKELFGK